MSAPSVDSHDDFGTWVRRRRSELLLTQDELAERAQVAVRTVRDIEAGRSARPRAHTRRVIEQAIGAPPAGSRPEPDRRRTGGPVRPAQLPPEPVGFVGRSAELAELDHLRVSGEPAPVCVVSGMPGVGKTALAIHWAQAARAAFPDGQLYVNLRGFDAADARLDPVEVLRGFLEAVGVPAAGRVSIHELVGLFRSGVADKRLLVLLDNAYGAEQVRPLLPAGPGSMTVVTSRDRLDGLVAVEGARPRVLGPCPSADGRAIVTARVGERRASAEPAALDRIVSRCGGLPLVLAVVSGRAALNPWFALADLADELDAYPMMDAVDGGEPASSLRSVFSWSYRGLGESAARMFRMVGHLPPTGFSADAAASAAGRPSASARAALAELSRTNLVTEELPGRFIVHDLIRGYAEDRTAAVDPPAEQRLARARVADHYLHTAVAAAALLRPHRPPAPPGPPARGVRPSVLADDGAAVEWFDQERSTLSALLHGGARDGDHRVARGLAQALAPYLERRARWSELVTTAAIGERAAARLGDAPGQRDALSMRGRAHAHLGDLDAAATCYSRAWQLATDAGDPAELAAACFDLALLASRQDDHAAALRHAEQARRHYRAAGDITGEAFALNAIGWDQVQLGEPGLALSCGLQAVELYREAGNGHGEAATWDTVGLAQQLLGRHEAAVTSFRTGLVLVRSTGDRPLEAQLLKQLGEAQSALGESEAARRTWRQALCFVDTVGEPATWAESIRSDLRARLAAAEPGGTGSAGSRDP